MAEYIDHMLSNYLSVNVGYSESEAIRHMKTALAASPSFEESLKRELLSALTDDQFPWKETLARMDVLHSKTSEQAKAYAKRILWDTLFGE